MSLTDWSSVIPFVGRHDALAECRKRFDDGVSVFNIVGSPGVGKSALARRVLAERRDEGARCLTLTCAMAESMGDLLSGAVDVLEIQEVTGSNAAVGDQVGRSLLATDYRVILLDDCDRIIPEVTACLAQWTQLNPHIHFIVTSRIRIELPGMRWLRLTPLSLPRPGVDWETLGESPAGLLFKEAIVAVRPDYQPNAPDLRALIAILSLLDGLPLGVLLAASRLRVLSPGQLFSRLEQSLELLQDKAGRSVYAAIRASWEILSQPQQDALRRLSLFRDAFDLRSVESMLSKGDGSTELFALELIQDLLDHSLLLTEDLTTTDGETIRRYRMPATIRDFVSQQWDDPNVHHDAEARYIRLPLVHASGRFAVVGAGPSRAC